MNNKKTANFVILIKHLIEALPACIRLASETQSEIQIENVSAIGLDVESVTNALFLVRTFTSHFATAHCQYNVLLQFQKCNLDKGICYMGFIGNEMKLCEL